MAAMPDPADTARKERLRARNRATKTAERRERGSARERATSQFGTRLSGGLAGGSTLLSQSSSPQPTLLG